MPFDHAASFDLRGIPGNIIQDVINISSDGTFVAVAIGYGFEEDRARSAELINPPTANFTPGAIALSQIPIAALIEGFRFNPRFERLIFDDVPPAERGRRVSAARERTLSNKEIADDHSQNIIERLKPVEEISFLFSIVDSGTGRELQDEPIHNLASLGKSNGERPFRLLAQPLTFQPRSTIRLQIVERQSSGSGPGAPMSVRRLIAYSGLATSGALLCFAIGAYSAQQSMALQLAENGARITALSDEMARSILQMRQAQSGRASGTDGRREPEVVGASGEAGAPLIDEIKRQLQSEMGLLPVRLLRERRQSFVEMNTLDNHGKSSYGTAGYLGNGFFITVKHGVVALEEPEDGREHRQITRITLRYKGKDLPARLIDVGDANVEVHPGDWAIVKIKGEVDLPALQVDADYDYEFAAPIFRLGNDYSKGIILSTGYVGQRTANGLVTCLTDGHPGVSGGGVLNQKGDLVGIPIGRMQGDYRFSFILPLRAEMFRKVPGLTLPEITTDN